MWVGNPRPLGVVMNSGLCLYHLCFGEKFTVCSKSGLKPHPPVVDSSILLNFLLYLQRYTFYITRLPPNVMGKTAFSIDWFLKPKFADSNQIMEPANPELPRMNLQTIHSVGFFCLYL